MKKVIQQALVVEGCYDAARLANIVDGTILMTDGFAVFKDKRMQSLLKRTARARGLILLTDSDAAGFQIRHFITGLVGEQYVIQAYIPALAGKERRKKIPGKEGLLGVEGVPDEVILQALDHALQGAPQQTGTAAPQRPITYTDLYEWGLSGTADSARRRHDFLQRLDLPPRLSKKELVQVLNTLYTYESLARLLQEDTQ